MRTLSLKTLFASFICLAAVHLRAGVTNLVWYRLGDSDPWATISGAVTNTTDFLGGSSLKGFGAAQYNNSLSSYAEEITGTTFGVSFNGVSGFLSNAPIVSATNSFCVEMWVRPNSVTGGQHFIAGNGNLGGGGNGWGIFQQGADFKAILGGVTTIEPVLLNMAVVGQWTHLALVQDVDLTVIYVNGVALGSTSNQPRPPTIGFTLGRHPQLPAGEFFNGTVDEVRVFRFGTGQFSFNDLLLRPRAHTLPATDITGTGALLRGLANPTGLPTRWWFQWGTTTNYGNATAAQSVGSGTGITNFSRLLNGLAANVTYHFRAVVSNALGTAFGTNQSFAVLSLPPSVATLQADTTQGFPVLSGTVNPQGRATTAWFEWGPTASYGNRTPMQAVGNGIANAPFSAVVAAYAGNHHFRAAASNSVGVAYGADQNFTVPLFSRLNLGLPGVYRSSVAWGDYDNDGRLDLLIAGGTADGQFISQVWRNNGSGFTNINAGLPGVQFCSVAWGDYDNDGRLDLVLSGDGLSAAQIWRNTGSGFTNINAALPQLIASSVAWGDYDNDGRLDLLITGRTNAVTTSTPVSQVWRNTGSGFANINAGLTGVVAGAVAWGDYDNDGRLDILLTGTTRADINTGVSQLWRNTGAGFVQIFSDPVFQSPVFFGVRNSTAAWVDFDSDGDLDVFLTGQEEMSVFSSRLYRNTGPLPNNPVSTPFPGVRSSATAWGDYDNDGLPDLLLTGTTTGNAAGAISQIWRNLGDGSFSNINANLPRLFSGSVAWADFNNDGRLDFVLTGTTNSDLTGAIAQLWQNNARTPNTPPAAPAGLTLTTSGSASGYLVEMAWSAANDAQTPSGGLTYNLRVGTTPGASDVLAPMAANSGFRRVAQMGNAQPRRSKFINVPFGQPVYWSVQAVDTAFAGSAFAPEQSFALNVTPPTYVPGNSNSVLGDANGNGIVDAGELNTVLSNYFPNSPFLQMTNIAGLGGTNVTFALTNNLAGAFSVEVTTNLIDWLFLGPATPRYEFTDTNAPAEPQRHYRLRWP